MPITNVSGLSYNTDINFNGKNFAIIDLFNGTNPNVGAITLDNLEFYYSFINITQQNDEWNNATSDGQPYTDAENYAPWFDIHGGEYGWVGGWPTFPPTGTGTNWRDGDRYGSNGVINAGYTNAYMLGSIRGATGSTGTGPGGGASEISPFDLAFSLDVFPDPAVKPTVTIDSGDLTNFYLYSEKTTTANKTGFQVHRTPKYKFQSLDTAKYIGFCYHCFGGPVSDTNNGFDVMAENLRYRINGLDRRFVIGVYVSPSPTADDKSYDLTSGIDPDSQRAIFIGGIEYDLDLFQAGQQLFTSTSSPWNVKYLKLPTMSQLNINNVNDAELYFYFAIPPSFTGGTTNLYKGDAAIDNIAVGEFNLDDVSPTGQYNWVEQRVAANLPGDIYAGVSSVYDGSAQAGEPGEPPKPLYYLFGEGSVDNFA